MKKSFHAPIPTTYNGVTFRSRLEAKWQVFFDELGFEASYESDFIKDENSEVLYVPDFTVYSGIKCRDWTLVHYIEIKPTPPNAEYISYLQSLPLSNEVIILVCVGPPDFQQKDGLWIMPIRPGEMIVQKGFALKQCPYCSQYNVRAWNRSDVSCECFDRFGTEEAAKKVSLNYRFDL